LFVGLFAVLSLLALQISLFAVIGPKIKFTAFDLLNPSLLAF